MHELRFKVITQSVVVNVNKYPQELRRFKVITQSVVVNVNKYPHELRFKVITRC